MTCEVVQTRWGTSVMRDVQAGEVMHPGVGPQVEAQLLYVEQSQLVQRLRARAADGGKPLVLFDVGLGAGSNALAAWLASQQMQGPAAPLEIVSFERDLSAMRLALQHGEAFGWVGEARQAAEALVRFGEYKTPRTIWRLQEGELLNCLAGQSAKADVVFWDPFSPKTNPTLWTVNAFSLALAAAGEQATLFTYSASTTVRIAMLLAGWNVGLGAAIGDKRATTAAAVRLADLQTPLDVSWLTRVTRADVRLPLDADDQAVAQVQSCPQFARPVQMP